MKKIFFALFVGLLCVSVAFGQSPKREMRSVWVAGMGIDWPLTSGTSASAQSKAKQQMTDYLDKFKAQNFTGICLHVRPRADAYYKSTLEPWSADISGTRGVNPGWDPLAFVIEECHKRGMECYAWVNPYRVNANGMTYTTDFDKQWDANGWLIRSGKWTSFNPGHPEARQHCFDVIKEIYTNYMIDGMLFDDYFYPGDQLTSNNADNVDDEQYQDYKKAGGTLTKYDWRRENVNSFVRDLHADIQKVRPGMRFGIGPAGISYKSASKYGLSKPDITSTDWQYDGIYADCLAWMNDKSIDFIAPQIYWARTHSTAPYAPLAKWWSDAAKHFGIHNYVSIASYKVETTEFGGSVSAGSKEIQAQVELTREYTLNNAPGAVYYNCKSMNGPGITGLGDHLAGTVYQNPVLVPVVDWLDRVVYAAPADAAKSGSTLSWTATKGKDKAIIRYTVYAIPLTVDYEAAGAADGDGISAEYLLDVTYSPSYTLPSDKTSGYWYAICVYDGYGFESEPATVGYSIEPSDAVSLTAPADGATVGYDVTFSWTAITDGSYRLEIARDAQFTDMFLRSDLTTATQMDVKMDGADENEKMYWRVVSSQPNKKSSYSEVRTLYAPRKSAGPVAALTAPADNAEFDGVEIAFSWTIANADAVEDIRLEIAAKGSSFDQPVYAADLKGTARTVTVATSLIGKGDFSWRVLTNGARINTGVSPTRSFAVTTIPIGTTEPGYTVKTDGVNYGEINNLRIENIWTRSAHRPYNNHTFGEKGMLNRGMTATKKAVYLSGREANSASAEIYLSEYSPYTGEHVRDIQLSKDGQVAYYPCNDVLRDSKDNIIISNLSLNASITPIILFLVDLSDGSLTEVARLNASIKRVDHVGVYGDVANGNFTVFAVESNGARVARWKVSNGVAASAQIRTFKAFYPASSGHFGIAPKIYPVSDSEFYIDGGSTAWTLYSFDKPSAAVSSFSENSGLAPAYVSDNGGRVFSLAENNYAVYNSTPSSVGSAQFQVAKTGTTPEFANYTALWKIPANGLGTVESTTCSAPVDAVAMSPITAHIYIYSPGNGLAAYRLTDTVATAVDDIFGNDTSATLGVTVSGRTVRLDATVASIRVYTTAGALVAAVSDTDTVTLPAAGLYVVSAANRSVLVSIR